MSKFSYKKLGLLNMVKLFVPTVLYFLLGWLLFPLYALGLLLIRVNELYEKNLARTLARYQQKFFIMGKEG